MSSAGLPLRFRENCFQRALELFQSGRIQCQSTLDARSCSNEPTCLTEAPLQNLNHHSYDFLLQIALYSLLQPLSCPSSIASFSRLVSSHSDPSSNLRTARFTYCSDLCESVIIKSTTLYKSRALIS